MDKSRWVSEPAEQYHAARKYMSASQLKLLASSARDYKKGYLDRSQLIETKPILTGRMIHSYLLEPEVFRGEYFFLPDKHSEEFQNALFTVDDLKKKAKSLDLKVKSGWKKEDISDALLELDSSILIWDRHIQEMSEGKIAISSENQHMLLEIFDAIVNYPQAFNMVKNGVPEMSGYWQDIELGIDGKIRVDMLTTASDRTFMLEIKSTHNIRYFALRNTIRRLRYDIGAAWYLRGYEKIQERPAAGYTFFFVQTTEPYNVVLYAADDSVVSLGTYGGENKDDEPGYRQCVDRYLECMSSGKWPGPQTRVEQMSLV